MQESGASNLSLTTMPPLRSLEPLPQHLDLLEHQLRHLEPLEHLRRHLERLEHLLRHLEPLQHVERLLWYLEPHPFAV